MYYGGGSCNDVFCGEFNYMKRSIQMKQSQRRRQQRAMQDKVVYGLLARAFASREKQEESNCKLKVDSSQCGLQARNGV